MYKCIIVDDEPHAIENLKKCIAPIPEFQVIQEFHDPVKALMEISAGEFLDLVILDIDMPGISGIELAREIHQKTDKLIFTTAHSKYGYEAFEVDADAYLLKPYSLSKFLSTIQKLFPKQKAALEEAAGKDRNYLFIKSKEDNNKLIRIKLEDIIAVESKLNYVSIYTKERTVTTYISLTEIAKKLLVFEGFIQFQRSFLVAENYIDYVEGNSIAMINGIKITVGEYYRKYFHQFVEEKLLKARRK